MKVNRRTGIDIDPLNEAVFTMVNSMKAIVIRFFIWGKGSYNSSLLYLEDRGSQT